MSSPDRSLLTLSSASYSVLSTLLASPCPFPPPPTQPLSAKLRHARALNKHLRASLDHAHALAAARRADTAKGKGKGVGDQNAPAGEGEEEEEDRLKRRIDKFRREAEGLRGSVTVYERLNAR